jgi:hypothetical protein
MRRLMAALLRHPAVGARLRPGGRRLRRKINRGDADAC